MIIEVSSINPLIAELKGWRAWDVGIFNNFFTGKWATYSWRSFRVVASSPTEARQVVLDNRELVLDRLLTIKTHNGRKLLPYKTAIPVNEKSVDDANRILPSTVTSINPVYTLTPDGFMMLRFNRGKICG